MCGTGAGVADAAGAGDAEGAGEADAVGAADDWANARSKPGENATSRAARTHMERKFMGDLRGAGDGLAFAAHRNPPGESFAIYHAGAPSSHDSSVIWLAALAGLAKSRALAI